MALHVVLHVGGHASLTTFFLEVLSSNGDLRVSSRVLLLWKCPLIGHGMCTCMCISHHINASTHTIRPPTLQKPIACDRSLCLQILGPLANTRAEVHICAACATCDPVKTNKHTQHDTRHSQTLASSQMLQTFIDLTQDWQSP